MTAPTPTTVEIGDVIQCTIKNSFGRYSMCVVEDFNFDLCVKEVASGRWVKVEKKEGGEHDAK